MNACIVSRQHIAALVEALYYYGITLNLRLEPAQVGQILWDENIASVQHCFHGARFADLPGACPEDFPYTQHTTSAALRDLVAVPAEAFALARSYLSQSSQHPEWEFSQAFQFVNALCTSVNAMGYLQFPSSV